MTDKNTAKRQVKSKQRVADHGEVFTADREVNAMLDLVKPETERIDSRFLEPACGNGNFLAEILRRKLAVVKSRYRKNALDYERFSLLALMSIYGVDILPDNVAECRDRLYLIWDKEYTNGVKKAANEEARNAARFILGRNVLCGDALTLLTQEKTPIIFSEWSFVMGDKVKRRDFRLDMLMQDDQPSLLNQGSVVPPAGWELDRETNAFIPLPIHEFPPTDYRRLIQYDE